MQRQAPCLQKPPVQRRLSFLHRTSLEPDPRQWGLFNHSHPGKWRSFKVEKLQSGESGEGAKVKTESSLGMLYYKSEFS